MTEGTRATYYVIKEGAVQEEAWEWENITQACRGGVLSPNARVFLPESNEWKRAGDTEELAEFFDQPAAEESSSQADEEALEALQAAYSSAVEAARDAHREWAPHIQAAGLAMNLGKEEEAAAHYQDALDAAPYNLRAVQDIKKNLPRKVWKTFRKLDRPESVWQDLGAFGLYPLSSGPLAFVVPAVVLAALTVVPAFRWVVAPLAALWITTCIGAAGEGAARLPLWHPLVRDPLAYIVRPALLLTAVLAMMCGPVAIAAVVVTRMGWVAESSAWMWFVENPILLVIVVTAGVVILPIVLMLAMCRQIPAKSAINPATWFRTAVRMEREYVAATIYIAFATVLALAANAFVGVIPYFGPALVLVIALYLGVCGGLVLGRLQARFRDEIRA